MKKRLSIILIGASVTVLAAIGAFASIAAQSTEDDSDSQSFVERVASILGLETSDVEDAFAQAKDEMREERTDSYLAKLVENGTLTQEEADAIQTWMDAKPDVEFAMSDKRGWGGKGFGGHHGSQVLSGDKLEYLIEEGMLTQADADALSEWYDDQPEAISKLMSNRGGWKNGEHRGRHGKRGWGRWGSDKDSAEDTSNNEVNNDA